MADMFDDELMAKLWETLAVMKAGKPTERSEKARRYAVAITEMEKVVAYYKTYVVDELCIELPPADFRNRRHLQPEKLHRLVRRPNRRLD